MVSITNDSNDTSSANRRALTAYHEAGHAALYLLFGAAVKRIEVGEDYSGVCRGDDLADDREELVALCAGIAAEYLYLQSQGESLPAWPTFCDRYSNPYFDESDHLRCVSIWRRQGRRAESARNMAPYAQEAAKVLSRYWDAVSTLAKDLDGRGVVGQMGILTALDPIYRAWRDNARASMLVAA